MLDTERSWLNFQQQVDRRKQEWDRRPLPYMRLNPDLHRKPPKLDAVRELDRLRKEVAIELRTNASRCSIERISSQLIASTFYFHKDKTIRSEGERRYGSFCHGRILCRFDSGTEALRSLGQFLQRQERIRFVMWENEEPDNKKEVSFGFIYFIHILTYI